jgi:nucleoid-associated protein YgaU
MIKRAQWGAKPLTAYSQKIAPPVRTSVVIHHSVTSEGKTQAQVEAILRKIDDQHRKNGWGGIGYNLAVDYDGRIYEARGIDILGAHATGMNTKGYGICYIGDGRKGITPKAVKGIEAAIVMLQNHSAKKLKVVGHRDVGSTACPGDKIYVLITGGKFNIKYPLVAPKPPKPPVKPPVKPGDSKKYVVARPGDSYWAIAVRVLKVPNTPRNYPKIIKETSRIKKLNNNKPISVGMRVRIK